MAPKRASYYSYGEDSKCVESRKYLEESGVLLTVRDIEKDPLTFRELDLMFGYIPLKHFLNKSSPSFTKKGLDKQLPARDEVFRLIAEDHTLLKRPIVKTIRLIMAGCDMKKMVEMLDLDRVQPEPQKHSNHGRRSGHKSSSGKSAASASK